MAGTAGRGACVVGGRAAGQQQTRVGLLVPGSGHRAQLLTGGRAAAELSTPRNVGGSRRIKIIYCRDGPSFYVPTYGPRAWPPELG